MRDDFRKPTIRILADRVNSICSNPGCRATTRGPKACETNAVNVGKAAHITAAAVGGPRYDASLTAAERAHFSNGIWLCTLCADLIDSDPDRFPVSLLSEWKRESETAAQRDLGRPRAILKGKLAIVSTVRRFGTETNVQLEEGRIIPFAFLSDPTEKDAAPTYFESNAFAVRFKIKKRSKKRYVILDELRAVVHRRQDLPSYRPLYGAYPAESSLYLITVDAPAEGHVLECTADHYFEAAPTADGQGWSRECTEQRFAPLIIDGDLPHLVTTRLTAKRAGLYWISLEAVLSHGLKTERHIVMGPTPILFADFPTFD